MFNNICPTIDILSFFSPKVSVASISQHLLAFVNYFYESTLNKEHITINCDIWIQGISIDDYFPEKNGIPVFHLNPKTFSGILLC